MRSFAIVKSFALPCAVVAATALPGCDGSPPPGASPIPRRSESGVVVDEAAVARVESLVRTPAATVLFDGGSLDGWRVVPGSRAEFGVEADELVVSGGPGFLETVETFGDFVLHFEFKTEAAGTNSGVFFRAEPGTEEAPSNGYELQICNAIADGDRSQPADYGDGWGTGAIFRRVSVELVNADDFVWNSATLIAAGRQFRTRINGVEVCGFVDEREPDPNPRRGSRTAPGHISLQGHDESTAIRFRNIRIAPLEDAP